MSLHAPGHRLHLAHAPRAQWGAAAPVPLQAVDALLLAWLVLEGPTTRQRLAQLLWPEAAGPQGRNNLRQRLFRLKRQLGTLVQAEDERVALTDGVAAQAVQDLADAGDLLRDCPLEAGAELQAWLDAQRQRLRLGVDADLARRCDEAARSRDWPVALGLAQALLARQPLSEDAHCRVIELHYLAGDRAAALLAFDQCERVLKEEVGARPSASTLALLRTVEAAGAGLALAAAPARTAVALLRPPVQVGRSAERQALALAWQARRTVLVLGEGGVGKTRLIEDFTAAHTAVLASGARPGDERVSYATASRLLRRLPPGLASSAPATARRYLACLLPELGPAATLDREGDHLRLFNACAQVLAQAAAADPARTGLVLDDLQFADRASAELFAYLVGAIDGPWLLASRPVEPGAAACDWVTSLRQDPRCDVLVLEPLNLDDVAELLHSLQVPALLPALDAAGLLRRTGGNPLYVLEVLKAALAEAGAGPARAVPAVQDVRGLIGQRIARLSPDAVQLARCAALAGPDFSIALAAQVLGVRTLALADPWAELEAAQILVDGAFAHDLVLEAARASVPQPVARALHGEIAQYLQAQASEPARTAGHWEQAQCWPEAGQAYRAAAQRALATGRSIEHGELLASAADCFLQAGQAAERFAALLERARHFGGDVDSEVALAAVDTLQALATDEAQGLEVLAVRLEVAVHRHDVATLMALAPSAVPAAQALGRGDLVLSLSLNWATGLLHERRVDEALALLAPLLAPYGSEGSTTQQYDVHMLHALALDHAGRMAECMRAYEQAMALAREAHRDDWVWKTQANSAGCLARMGRVHDACAAYEQALRIAHDIGHGDHPRAMQERHGLGGHLRDLGRYEDALQALEPLLAPLAREGMASDLAIVHNRLSQLYLYLGQPARAHALLGQPMQGLIPGMAVIRRALQGEVAARLGGDGVPALREALAMLDDPNDVFHRTTCLLASGLLPADEAEALAAAAAGWASRTGRMGLALFGHVRAAARACDQAAWLRAAAHAESALALAAIHGPNNFYLPELWLAAARTSQGLGRLDEARAHAAQGLRWVSERLTRDVPAPFRESFEQRNPVNVALRALAARLG